MTATFTRRQALQAATFATAAAAVGATGPAAPAHAGDRPADLIIHNGRALLMDPADRTTQAVAVRAGHIIAVGTDRDLRRLAGPRTQLLDARAGTIMPGINDSHLHLSAYGLTRPPLSIDVDTATLPELVTRVAEAAATAPPGAWIRGRGWSELRLPRPPTRHDLDPVTGEHPAVLTDFTLHACVANTAALRLAGITADTAAPAGAIIERDADGQPTGLLREGAQDLLHRVVPTYTDAEMATAITAAVAALHGRGITSVTDPGITPHLAAVYQQLAADGVLTMRTTALLHAGDSPQTMRDTLAALPDTRGPADPRIFRVAGVKVFGDGVPTQARTAWMHRPYSDGNNGRLTIAGTDPAQQAANLYRMIHAAHRAGAQIGTHACGDATVDAVIAAYLAAQRSRPHQASRHYVIHGDFATARALQLMGRHDIAITMNAEIKYMIGRVLEPLLGTWRTDYHWPYRTAQAARVRVSTGSDAPVTDPNWLHGLTNMITRVGADGQLSGRDQRISLQQALRTYTTAPAWQDHAERWKGTLQPGMAADICVLDTDLRTTHPRDYPHASIHATIAAGRIVHHRDTPTAAAAKPMAAQRDNGCCCELAARLHAI
ncbi:amidohydrolase [Catellatospora paridis]|uniref:amidohydrolase n=1 Tax=Catellatospora paridis TaxID=1617086 RepID=UPI0012D4881F|nr:amidohydrolase [Catellatospora paridis]